MKDRFTRKLSMAGAVKKVMDNNLAIWSGTPIMVTKHTELDNTLKLISNYQLLQNTDISGYAVLKQDNKEDMADRAMDVAKPTTTFARDTGDKVLLRKMDFELTDIAAAKDSDAVEFCRLILEEGTASLPDMGDYPISSATLGELDEAIKLFDVSIDSPKVAHSEISAVIIALEVQIDLLDEVLEGLDELMVTFKSSEPDFYNSYVKARKLDNTGIRHISARGKLTDAEDGAVITKARVTAVAADGSVQEVESSVRGLYRFFSLEPGSYTFTFEHEGYETVTMEHIAIATEGIKQIDVQMPQLPR